ncbi:MAG: hypothetical protein ACLP5H_07220 [Desulfomonilaceae bacterium]
MEQIGISDKSVGIALASYGIGGFDYTARSRLNAALPLQVDLREYFEEAPITRTYRRLTILGMVGVDLPCGILFLF